MLALDEWTSLEDGGCCRVGWDDFGKKWPGTGIGRTAWGGMP